MKVDIKLIDPTLPLPSYQTGGAVAFDLYSRIEMEVKPRSLEFIPLNVVIKIPEGYALVIASRSSTPRKKGLFLSNGVGVIDQDFCGDENEIQYLCYNFTDDVVKIERGERIAQGMFVKIDKADLNQVEKMSAENRGSYGSTGSK